MQALLSILLISPNKFNKFNNTGTQMQDSIYHMTLKSHLISRFSHPNIKTSPLETVMFLCHQHIML